MFKIIPLRSVAHVSRVELVDADSRACADMPGRRGVPRTDREWTALVKVASGEIDIPDSQFARLVALKSGLPELTPHGRLTLGLPE